MTVSTTGATTVQQFDDRATTADGLIDGRGHNRRDGSTVGVTTGVTVSTTGATGSTTGATTGATFSTTGATTGVTVSTSGVTVSTTLFAV